MILLSLTLVLVPVLPLASACRNATTDPAHPTPAEFREASFAFFTRMKDAGHGAASAVVFGAASIKNHFPDFRSTPDLDLIVFEPNDLRLDAMLEAMVAGSGGKLSWENDKELLYYNTDGGRRVHLDAGYVDFGELYGTAMAGSAAAAAAVTSVQAVPYASPEEMFVIKICAARSRAAAAKALQDVDDADFIAERLPVLQLVGDPPERAVGCLKAFLPRSRHDRRWWLEKLGVGSRCPPHDGGFVKEARARDVCWGNAVLLAGQEL
ncbi:hypothetical protein UCDDS831_g00702 [Diplodia seriata]|uniref:Uncharacterized protein n=1 Tax=Diplodia seriata TaxID=420778 RepID=A0A0G2GWK3_9PEZI|nr:hypothetical protein UCDDS831_g00702 [Diplodia seriata]